jgi:hypothetical protein
MMLVPMMDVREVSVRMSQRLVTVLVRVGLRSGPWRVVRVLMVLVMAMPVTVHQGLVVMLVLVTLAHV